VAPTKNGSPVVRFLRDDECDTAEFTMLSSLRSSVMASESMPCVYGSVAFVDSDPPSALITTATLGNSTLNIHSDLDGEVSVKSVIIVDSQATPTRSDVAPVVPVISGPPCQLETKFDDAENEEEVSTILCHDIPQVNYCQDDPDCPFCGPHANCLLAFECGSSNSECDDEEPDTRESVAPLQNQVTFTVDEETENSFVAEYVDKTTGHIMEVHVRKCGNDDDDPHINRLTCCGDIDSDDDLMSDDDADSDDMIDDDDLCLSDDDPGEDMDMMADIMAKVEGYAMNKFGYPLPGLTVDMRVRLGAELVDDGPKCPTGLKGSSCDVGKPREEDGLDFK